jgi:ataxin-3
MTSNGSNNNNNNNGGEVWIYHERQEALLCGQHALNNLIQDCVFTAESLAEMAHQLDEMELTYMSANNEGGIK